MNRLFRGITVKLLVAFGLLPLAIVPSQIRDWRQMCRGGRENPNYCVNECGDMESLMIVMPMLIAVMLIPAILFIIARAMGESRRASERSRR